MVKPGKNETHEHYSQRIKVQDFFVGTPAPSEPGIMWYAKRQRRYARLRVLLCRTAHFLMKLAFLAIVGCGRLPANSTDIVVSWDIKPNVVTCSAKKELIPITDYPVGWFCSWPCAYYQGDWHAVKAVFETTQDTGAAPPDTFLPAAAPIYVGECATDLSCPECDHLKADEYP